MLELRGISKRFGSAAALQDVSLTFAAGEIHALLGENGAGKTTLMRILYGLLRPDSGSIHLDGRPLHLRRPADAQRAGIGMVHQHFMLVDRLTVGENIVLGHVEFGFRLSPRRIRMAALEAAGRVGLAIEPDRRAGELSVGERQRVEIVKALMRGARTLILDEPTAVLTPAESATLFDALRRLRDAGCRVIFISHKLAEVTALCDRASVLRAGRVVCSEPIGRLTPGELAERMVAAPVAELPRRPGRTDGKAVVSLPAGAAGNRGAIGAGLVVRRGEVVGVAGVEGNGQADWVAAARRAVPASAYIPEDRHRQALAVSLSVTDNLILRRHADVPLARHGWLSARRAEAYARELLERHAVRPVAPEAPVTTLSGGNQQKLVIGRELAESPPLIVAVNPTRGLDVAATRYVHVALLDHRDAGAGVLLVSSDLDEILRLADRLYVLFSGRLTEVAINAAGRTDLARLGRLMGGVAEGRGVNSAALRFVWGFLTPIVAVAVGLLAMLAVVTAFGYPAGAVAQAFWEASAGSRPRFFATLLLACPLLVIALGQALTIRAGLWNIGSEGQYLLGAIAAAAMARFVAGLPMPLACGAALLAGVVGGAAYAGVAALLRHYRGVGEVLPTILLNFVAVQILTIAVRGPLVDANSVDRDTSAVVPHSARLPLLDRSSGLHAGVVLAVALAVATWLLLERTVWGYRLRFVGANPLAAAEGGIAARRVAALALCAGGGFAGLAGAIELAGNSHYLTASYSSGYGYTAIAVALLARCAPLRIILAAIFFAALESGAAGLQKLPDPRLADFPTVLTFAAQGTVVLVALLMAPRPDRPAGGAT